MSNSYLTLIEQYVIHQILKVYACAPCWVSIASVSLFGILSSLCCLVHFQNAPHPFAPYSPRPVCFPPSVHSSFICLLDIQFFPPFCVCRWIAQRHSDIWTFVSQSIRTQTQGCTLGSLMKGGKLVSRLCLNFLLSGAFPDSGSHWR